MYAYGRKKKFELKSAVILQDNEFKISNPDVSCKESVRRENLEDSDIKLSIGNKGLLVFKTRITGCIHIN